MEFECLGEYLGKCNSTKSTVIVPTTLKGICADAFATNMNVTDLVLPENIIYCVSLDSRLISSTIRSITIHNACFSGILDIKSLPALRKIEVLDTDAQRLSSIRARSLLTQIAQLPESVEVYFPHCNLYACDRNDLLDVKLCVRFLKSKWLYDEDTQKNYMSYIKLHEYAIMQYLASEEQIEALRAFIPTADPAIISQALELLQDLGDTEITALALDLIGKSGQSTSSSAFDLSFLDDILAVPDASAETKPSEKTSVFEDVYSSDFKSDFEIRGVEGNCVVVGAYTGEPCDCFIIPDEINNYAVEGIGAATVQPSCSPTAIAVGKNIKALFRHAFMCYDGLLMLLFTQNVTYIDETAINIQRIGEIVIYCPPGCYAEMWALEHGFRVKSSAAFIADLRNQGVADA